MLSILSYSHVVFNSAIVLLCLDKKYKRRGNKVKCSTHKIIAWLCMTLESYVLQPPGEAVVTEEDVTFKSLLPCVQCGIHELPDSDGKRT